MDTFGAEAPEYAKEIALAPRKTKGWVHEVEVPMRAGETLAYETSHAGRGEVEFNIHSHQGPQVTYHAKGRDPRIAGTFAAPWEGKFYLMWENLGGEPVRVSARARRQ